MRLKGLLFVPLAAASFFITGCERDADPIEETGDAFEDAGDAVEDAGDEAEDRLDR